MTLEEELNFISSTGYFLIKNIRKQMKFSSSKFVVGFFPHKKSNKDFTL